MEMAILKIVAGILAGVAALYLLVAVALYLGQRRVLYLPDDNVPEPARAGVPEMERVSLATGDGLSLAAWWRPPTMPDRPTLVHFHGNGGHIGHRGVKMRPYLDAGFGLLMVEYRGYGGNPGRPTEQGLYRDGRAALAHVDAAGIPRDRLVLYGESLGSGIAVQLASEGRAAAVILESPYTSMAAAAAHHYPWLPARPLIHDRYDSLAKIARIGAPLLVLHGERDRVVPVRMARALMDAAARPKEAVYFPQAGHEDLYQHGAAEAVLAFLTRLDPG